MKESKLGMIRTEDRENVQGRIQDCDRLGMMSEGELEGERDTLENEIFLKEKREGEKR